MKTRKIVIGSDTQIPFHKPELIDQVIGEGGNVLVWLGDILDCHSIAMYPPSQEENYLEAFKYALDVFKASVENYPKVVAVAGNHDERHRRMIQRTIPQSVRFSIPQDILMLLKNGLIFDNEGRIVQLLNSNEKKLFDERFYYTGEKHEDRWWALVGDAAMLHPETFLRRSMGTSEKALSYVYSRHLAQNPNVICVAHTHMAGHYFIDGGRAVVETGCLCYEGDYSHTGKLGYRPATNAYVTMIQELVNNEWKTDLDSIKVNYLGPARNFDAEQVLLKL